MGVQVRSPSVSRCDRSNNLFETASQRWSTAAICPDLGTPVRGDDQRSPEWASG